MDVASHPITYIPRPYAERGIGAGSVRIGDWLWHPRYRPGGDAPSTRASVAGRRLPELEPGAFRLDCPSEAPVLRLLQRIDHLDPSRAQLGQHRVEIGHAEVHHEGLV